jgi:hypothetical protein
LNDKIADKDKVIFKLKKRKIRSKRRVLKAISPENMNRNENAIDMPLKTYDDMIPTSANQKQRERRAQRLIL